MSWNQVHLVSLSLGEENDLYSYLPFIHD